MRPHPRRVRIALLYAAFAGVAIATNLATQRVVELGWTALGLWPQLEVYAALVAGTGTGLIVKYLLDKRWIFAFTARSFGHDIRTFILYTVMGISTTAIFWITELLFETALHFPGSRYVGGFIGLTVGYTTKYFLDRRFVFRQADGGTPRR